MVAALNVIVKTCMEYLAVIWDDSGYSKSSIQQRCEVVKKYVQVNAVLYDYQLLQFSGFRIVYVFVLLMQYGVGDKILLQLVIF
jgi:hypothetical protein